MKKLAFAAIMTGALALSACSQAPKEKEVEEVVEVQQSASQSSETQSGYGVTDAVMVTEGTTAFDGPDGKEVGELPAGEYQVIAVEGDFVFVGNEDGEGAWVKIPDASESIAVNEPGD